MLFLPVLLACGALLAGASPLAKRDISYTQESTSTGAKLLIFWIDEYRFDVPSRFGKQSSKDPGTWTASDRAPVCQAYCLNPDPNVNKQYCHQPACPTTINPLATYVINNAVNSVIGSDLVSCGPGCVNIISTGASFPLAA